MQVNIPFLTIENDDISVTEDMELASAFLYFETNKSDSLKSFFSKQYKENITWISRGLYTLKGKLFKKEDMLYCLYDDLDCIGGHFEIGCSPDKNIRLDIDKIRSMDVPGIIDTLKKVSLEMSEKEKHVIEDKYIVSGYKELQTILKERHYTPSKSGTVRLEEYYEPIEHDNSCIENTLNKIEKSIEKEIEILKALCVLDDDSFKNSVSEKNKIYEEYKDKIYQTDKEVSSNISKLIIEREDRIRNIDKIFRDKIAFITQDYILNKNKYDIAKIYGNEIEMGIYQRSITESEGKREGLKKECDEETKRMEDYYDGLIEEDKNKIKQAISDRNKKVSECESLYKELHTCVEDLKKAVSDDVFSRRRVIEEIKENFFKYDSLEEADSIKVDIPFFIAEYDGGETRYKLFMPQGLVEKSQIMTLLSGIAGKITLPFNVRDKFFEDLLKGFKEFLKRDEGIKIINEFSKNNLINKEDSFESIESGLKSLLNYGYLNDKNYERALSSLKDVFVKE